jgi:hypothetical protein
MIFAHLSRTGRLLCAAGIFAVLAPLSAPGEIHVALDGKDDNPGTRTAQLRTVQRGAELAQPGDTVTVHAGIYHRFAPQAIEATLRKVVFHSH